MWTHSVVKENVAIANQSTEGAKDQLGTDFGWWSPKVFHYPIEQDEQQVNDFPDSAILMNRRIDELLSYFDASASDSWDDQRPVEEADEKWTMLFSERVALFARSGGGW